MSLPSRSVFKGITDIYDGVTVDSEVEACSSEEFPIKLEESLQTWQQGNKTGIWFKVGLNQAEWIPFLAKKGFKFHHARDDFVMMYKWLPKQSSCTIPQFANTMIGVGAVVINDKKEILVVSEKRIARPHWKLPGGYVEEDENLVDAAIREVTEETNVKTEFLTLLTLRHGHNSLFGCSDIYFVVALKPLSEDIKKYDGEIKSCEWMKIDTYLNHPHIHELNKFYVQKYLGYEEKNIKIECTHDIHPILKKPYTVYHVISKDDEEKN